jgi:transposase
LTNNASERALRGIALGSKAWLFAGSDRGGQRAAFMYRLIVIAKLNDIDPQAWLADVWPASPIIQAIDSMTCCHGTGRLSSRSGPPYEQRPH